MILASGPARSEPLPAAKPDVTIDRICALIASSADKSGLPRDFFARLIWKESRFDHNAVSPVGAEGIAQFMPGTAKIVGLADPFDIEQAIPASAAYLARLHAGFGNWGLAAAAYNGGETRVGKWLSSGGFLPLETEDYVLDITGRSADHFSARGNELEPRPLDAKLSFDEGCRKLPIIASTTVAMSQSHAQALGHSGGRQFPPICREQTMGARAPRSSRRSCPNTGPSSAGCARPIGRRGIYAVRIGANSRAEADNVCAALRSSGGACIVTKNR